MRDTPLANAWCNAWNKVMESVKVVNPKLKELKELGGYWQAERVGFGSWKYTGIIAGNTYVIQAFAHSSYSDFEGDTYVRWHVFENNKDIIASSDVVYSLRNHLVKKQQERDSVRPGVRRQSPWHF